MDKIPGSVLVGLAILAADKRGREQRDELVTIKVASAVLIELQNAGASLDGVAIRHVPGGWYSDDIATQIGAYISAGFADSAGCSSMIFRPAGRRQAWQQLGEVLLKHPKVGELARVIRLF